MRLLPRRRISEARTAAPGVRTLSGGFAPAARWLKKNQYFQGLLGGTNNCGKIAGGV
jgi:hypothetical protein